MLHRLLLTFLVLLGSIISAAQSNFQLALSADSNLVLLDGVKNSNSLYYTGHVTDALTGIQRQLLVKTDLEGVLQWNRTFEASSNLFSGGIACAQANHCVQIGHLAAGPLGSTDLILTATDSSGNFLWSKAFGGAGTDLYGDILAVDSGYLVAGHSNSMSTGELDLFYFKINLNGDVEWSKGFGGSENEVSYALLQLADGNFLLTGETKSVGAGELDALLIKFDAFGDTLWTSVQGGVQRDEAWFSVETANGEIISTGLTDSYGASTDVLWLKSNAFGVPLEAKVFTGFGNDQGKEIYLDTASNSYYIVGKSSSTPTNDFDMFCLKLDAQDSLLQQKRYGRANRKDQGHAILALNDSSLQVIGDSKRINTNLQTGHIYTVNQQLDATCDAKNLALSPASLTIQAHRANLPIYNFGTSTDLPLNVFSNPVTTNDLCLTTNLSELTTSTPFTLYPNPSSNQIHIKNSSSHPIQQLIIKNLAGQTLQTIQPNSTHPYDVTMDVSTFARGFYFVMVSGGAHQKVFRVILE